VPRDLYPEEQPKILARLEPQFIQGRPSCLEILAREIKRSSALIHRPGLIVSYAEPLYPDVRALLTDVFECPVVDYYNCEEIGNIAYQCPVRNDIMHINSDACIVEVVDDCGRPVPYGTEGRLLLTSLYNVKMPFIRCAIGDRGVLIEDHGRPCGCGRRGPRMSLVFGREEDFFITPDGRMISPRVTVQLILDVIKDESVDNLLSEAIRGFQVVQEDLRNITVRVIPGETFDPQIETFIDAGFKDISKDWKCRLEIAAELSQESSGKFRKIVNLLPKNKHFSAKA
jgi:phenylacetate-CoA ligase